MMERVFLDANVLFSAAWTPDGKLNQLWNLRNVEIVSSQYAVEEARRNLALNRPEGLKRLEALVRRTNIVDQPAEIPDLNIAIAEKDLPILAAAISAKASYLLTGDKAHFGKFFGKRVMGVKIQLPGDFLAG